MVFPWDDTDAQAEDLEQSSIVGRLRCVGVCSPKGCGTSGTASAPPQVRCGRGSRRHGRFERVFIVSATEFAMPGIAPSAPARTASTTARNSSREASGRQRRERRPHPRFRGPPPRPRRTDPARVGAPGQNAVGTLADTRASDEGLRHYCHDATGNRKRAASMLHSMTGLLPRAANCLG